METYERPAVEEGKNIPRQSVPSKEPRKWTPLPAWSGALAAAAGLGVLALSFIAGSAFQNARGARPPALSASSTDPLLTHTDPIAFGQNWTDIRRNCTRLSAQRETCDLLASAAELQLATGPKKSPATGPVVIAALQKSPVSAPVITHVQGALETHVASDPQVRERVLQDLRAFMAAREKDPASTPDTWLTVAKLQFKAGESVQGFESLVRYVASDNTAAAQALKVGFVDPIRITAGHQPEIERAPGAQPSGMPSGSASPPQAYTDATLGLTTSDTTAPQE